MALFFYIAAERPSTSLQRANRKKIKMDCRDTYWNIHWDHSDLGQMKQTTGKSTKAQTFSPEHLLLRNIF